ncbi:hypothetical protein AA106556_0429 [Neokomagataea tanensis NBRC 106556]|uniref:Uncharacterized protein n=1 Tax=Neokomagataea tanensis NBRC 106556 TaxID=1223519 RepID=A0ABQ0QGX5_9PROT|nr:hypothetical protein AA106556_0429 [Neokomagataea tanensis NBRC 106556]
MGYRVIIKGGSVAVQLWTCRRNRVLNGKKTCCNTLYIPIDRDNRHTKSNSGDGTCCISSNTRQGL